MAVNFPNNPNHGDVFSNNGISFVYSNTHNAWSSSENSYTNASVDAHLNTSTASNTQVLSYTNGDYDWVDQGGGGVTTYADITQLPLSGQDNGAQAFVTGTNRLYIWNGSGWYNIALINTNPSISGASATYDLSTEGANTVVTLVASDPEGIPISFTATHSGIGAGANAIATVTQSNNIFTYTPTSNTSLGGTFTTTFTASDGVNLGTANSSFTLTFVLNVTNSRYTTALITPVGGNNGSALNQDFVDSSTNSHTVTASGDVYQRTISPTRSGGYSHNFDGTGDWIDSPNHADFDLDGEFTIEFWVYLPGSSHNRTVQRVIAPNSGSYGNAPYISIGNDTGITGGPAVAGVLCLTSAVNNGNPEIHANQTGTSATGTYTTVPLNTWVHVAVSRDSSNVVRLFQAGSLVGKKTISSDFDFTYGGTVGARIGRSGWGSSETFGPGFLKDFRIIKGTCLYDQDSGLTVPTETLTAVTNTKYLLFSTPYLKDASSTNHALTVSGDLVPEPDGPYDYVEYTASSHGGSMDFDGTGDFLRVANDNTAMDLTTSGSWTLEAWYKLESTSEGNNIVQRGGGSGSAWSGTDGVAYTLQTNGSAQMAWYWNTNGGNGAMAGSTTMVVNRWYHIAISHNGTTTSMFINGVRDATSTPTYHQPSTRDIFNVGSACVGGSGASGYFNGSISQFRIVNGTAVYDPTQTTCTVPTSALTAINNTSVLLSGTNANIIDKSQKTQKIIRQGDPVTSTTQKKYLTSSIHFDGNDYLQMDSEGIANFGTGDFTAEGWFLVDSLPGGGTIYSIVDARGGNTSTGWTFGMNASGAVYVYAGSQVCGSGGSISTGTWYHWAFTRSGNTGKMFLDGTQIGITASSLTNNFSDTKFRIGANHSGGESFTGYQFDVRMTKGLARYTSNFTRPAAALEG